MIADLHSDLLIDLAERRVAGERDVFRRRHLPALRAAGVRVQVLDVFIPTQLVPDGALRYAMRLLDAALHEEQESDGALRLVRTARELDAAVAAGAVAGILAMEGADPLGREPALIRTFARIGVRMAGLTWNRANDFADGALEDRGAGITPLGIQLMAEMADAGVALDLSHLTERGARTAIERFTGAVLVSHSNAAAVHASVRNISDDVIRGVAGRGGVVGLNFLPAFSGSERSCEALGRHAAHIAAVGGPAVPACGADFVAFLSGGLAEPGTLAMPPDPLRDAPEPARESAYAELGAVLGERAPAVLWDNAVGFLRRALG